MTQGKRKKRAHRKKKHSVTRESNPAHEIRKREYKPSELSLVESAVTFKNLKLYIKTRNPSTPRISDSRRYTDRDRDRALGRGQMPYIPTLSSF